MIGALGPIIFEISEERALPILSMSRDVSGRWATHDTQGTKQRKEFLGPGLQKITLTVKLSAVLGVPPRQTLETLERMIEGGYAEYLVIGRRTVGRRPFCIMSASETWGEMYNRGELASAEISLSLEEYA